MTCVTFWPVSLPPGWPVSLRDQADFPHLRGPFLVVVAGPRRLAEMVLPEMGHFMRQRRQRSRRRAAGEVGRVQGDFVGHLLRVADAGEPLAGKIAVGSLVPLHGDEAGRELCRRTARG